MSASILSGVVTTPYVAFETSLSGTTVDLVSANDIATASGFDEGNNSPYAGFMPVMILM